MNPELVAIFAFISAANARLEGMLAENSSRLTQNLALAYSSEDFFYEAQNLENLAVQARSAI
jgi:hypothetical protein